ncbi:MAG: TIGR03667 family PPOX class F420-dependent oxidoreductase [Candidatus Dormibacteraeota bacterium]|nr:TIGR03667 family PPOX class F420-dependent oxidoreductase [Candidatus Dormibacteraeota bacterium]
MEKGPIDTTTPLGRRTVERLETEIGIWLTTVAPDGTPQPNPVWFLWDGATVLIYSHNKAARLRNLRGNPRVALNFDSPDGGDSDVNIVTGSASLAPEEPPPDQNAAYLAKYAAAITRIGMDTESFTQLYSVALRVTPEKVRGF